MTLLPTFIIKGNAKFQLEVSERKEIFIQIHRNWENQILNSLAIEFCITIIKKLSDKVEILYVELKIIKKKYEEILE